MPHRINRGNLYADLGRRDLAMADFPRAQTVKPGEPTTARAISQINHRGETLFVAMLPWK